MIYNSLHRERDALGDEFESEQEYPEQSSTGTWSDSEATPETSQANSLTASPIKTRGALVEISPTKKETTPEPTTPEKNAKKEGTGELPSPAESEYEYTRDLSHALAVKRLGASGAFPSKSSAEPGRSSPSRIRTTPIPSTPRMKTEAHIPHYFKIERDSSQEEQ